MASLPGPVPGAGQKDPQEEEQQGWQEGWLRLVLPGKRGLEGHSKEDSGVREALSRTDTRREKIQPGHRGGRW